MGPALAAGNLTQAVPFFGVHDITAALRFYVGGLGFEIRNQWAPDGRIRWCWLQRGGAALMLQEFWREGHHAGAPEGALGQGVSICFMCADAPAIYREATAQGLAASLPTVGNGLWVVALTDPDGYQLFFESPTDAPEGSTLIG